MWCYKIVTALLPGESPDAAYQRTRDLPGVVAAEWSERCATGYYPAPDVSADTAIMLAEHPELLPGTARLAWLDIQPDDPAIHIIARQPNAKSLNVLAQHLTPEVMRPLLEASRAMHQATHESASGDIRARFAEMLARAGRDEDKTKPS